jgi:hypothetical protein
VVKDDDLNEVAKRDICLYPSDMGRNSGGGAILHTLLIQKPKKET